MCNRLFHWVIPVAVLVLSVAAVVSAEDERVASRTMTLSQVLDIVTNTNPEILEARKRYEGVLAERSIARSGYRPTIGAELAAGPEVTDGEDTNDEREELTAATATVYARMNLFNGGRTRATVRETDARILSAAYEVLNVSNRVFLDTAEAYLGVLQAKEMLALAKKNVATQEKILKQVREKAESGFNRISDLKNSEARFALAQSNYISRQQNLNQSVVKFHRQFGRFVSPDSMERPAPSFGVPDTVEKTVDIALKNHPALWVSRSNIEVRKHAVDKAKSAYWPTLDLELKAQHRSDTGGDEGDTDQASAMLKLNYTFFDGGVRKGETLKNNKNLHGENYRGYLERRNVNESVRLAWNILQAEKQREQYLGDHVRLSSDTLAAFKEEYHLGRRTLLDLLNMENEYNSAESALVESVYSCLVASYRIAGTTGLMLREYDPGLRKEMGLPAEPVTECLVDDELEHNRDLDSVDDPCDQCDNSIRKSRTPASGCAGGHNLSVGFDKAGALDPYIVPEKGTPEALDLKIDTSRKEQTIALEKITFKRNSGALTTDARRQLAYVADQLKAADGFFIEVIGHTDTDGSRAYNLKLSKKRARSVCEALVALGVSRETLSWSGKGESEPVADNTTMEGKRKNRRTEFKLTQRVRS
ncbi:outer membrane protein, adhesin transport system [Desulfoluna spongiiphila]|uniref:Outer membrane protein, adhesin transport system n=1 Tax=Desulfoluna spongiiphila TaxID=419481 RepID=A0A1G5IZA7_9BACT|nr:outer membrane protein, adhesin transport system [Desulfoluna spongiiphila]